jgi:hypothetical protein
VPQRKAQHGLVEKAGGLKDMTHSERALEEPVDAFVTCVPHYRSVELDEGSRHVRRALFVFRRSLFLFRRSLFLFRRYLFLFSLSTILLH